MSPRTTSRPAIRFCRPSRITSARGLERSLRASKARSVRRSWTMVMPMTTKTKPKSIRASLNSPISMYSPPHATSMRNMGSRTTSRAMASTVRRLLEGNSL